jgi:hypothetical protein
MPKPPLRWLTLLLALTQAGAALLTRKPDPPDSMIFWTAGRALLEGGDPYAAVLGLGTGYPLFYPIPAVLVVAPFAWLPWPMFHLVISGLSGFALGWAAERYGRGLAVGVLSAGFAEAMVEGQWSPLLTAAAVLPALGALWAAKPTIGAALFAAFPSRRAALGAVALVGAGTLVWPSWPWDWSHALRLSNHVAPILQPGGFLLLLAATRWRRPEGRLLVGLALVPQTAALYETLPLFLIPSTRRQAYLMAVGSYLAAVLGGLWAPGGPGTELGATFAARWPFVAVLVWLPALVMVLRQPNLAPPAVSS